MNLKSLFFPAIILFSFISCKNENKKDMEPVSPTETRSTMEYNENQLDTIPTKTCYQYITAKDTVVLRMEKMNGKITGDLSYHYYEKDKNDGNIEGHMKGDTLFAQYIFDSEGTTSIREVVFLKNGGKMMEGYGEVEEINGKFQFKKGTQLKFNEKMPLVLIDCDKN